MLNVVLIIHLILALCLIAVVLLQRSEGGALGIGGGGGGAISQRGATTALAKITWALAIGFLCTSMALTILAQRGGTGSVLERFEADGGGAIPLPNLGLPASGEGDLVPPAPAE
ncbi:MAG TPA: preprotein translocase subunit SecG [Thermohalobaculum sp.]|nr:preprotein translocase subunit SecG [Thermohalobaculum sp.]